MNRNIISGNWKQVQGKAQVWWGKVTDGDLKKAGGKINKFIGSLRKSFSLPNKQKNQKRRKNHRLSK